MIMSQSEEVQTKVLNSLYWDLAVPPHRVKVEVENGWVTIFGTVDRYYQRTCAESDARRVAGVLGVNNHIRLASANAIPKFNPSEMDILTTGLEATIAFQSDAVVGSASGKNHSGRQSPERDTEANDELVRQVQGLESVVITTTPP